MADALHGLTGNSVRGMADNFPDSAQSVANSDLASLERTVRQAAELIREAVGLTGTAVEKAVDAASNAAFASAANVGTNIASPPAAQAIAQSSFSWGGYFQAIGILCLLLAALWFGVWLLRKYGRFNFLPKPGALPKGALMMEAQMPLGPRKGLMVVRFLNRRLLLGVTEHQISLLTEDNSHNERPAKKFQDIMDDARDAGGSAGSGGDSA